MAEISIKSFFLRRDNSVEIRRFALPKEHATKFSILLDKLVSVYNGGSFQGALNTNEIELYWKDEEGDEISISTDDELIYALKAQNGDVFKIYMRKINRNSSPSTQDKCHHPGVVCDCCNKEIYGYRYKCMDCPNYDLCNSCEQDGNHSEHNMIRWVSPNTRIPRWFTHRPHPRPYKWRKHSDNGASGDGPGNKRPCEGRRARFGEPFHPYNLLNKMWSAFGAHLPNQPPQNQQTGENPGPSGTQNAEANAAPNNDDYLRNIGETVAAMLDPLGIDVLVDIERNGVRSKVNKPQPNENDVPMSDTEKKTNQEKSTDAETGVAENSNLPQASAPMDAEEQSITSPEAEGWTCIGQEIVKGVEESLKNLPELLSEFHVADDKPDLIHPDPAIAESVQLMMSMGYNNESGWLTALVDLCKGHVDRVLELLSDLGEPDGPSSGFIQTFVALLEKHDGDVGKVVAIMRSTRQK